MDSTEAILEEVQNILNLISSGYDIFSISSIFKSTIDLFNGNYPGYLACNTAYHDLHHTTDTFLAMARLIHGAMLNNQAFTDRQITLGLMAALVHDAGYIQEEHDTEGTGSKYTDCHVQRSMAFLESFGKEHGLTTKEISSGKIIIQCTDVAIEVSTIDFPSVKVELLGKMLGAADLQAQMADRIYLEKLLFLYHEFKEANIGDYKNEVDLLQKTIGFYDFIAHRLGTILNNVNRFMTSHFVFRWNIHGDLYHDAIEKNRIYLQQILEIPNMDPRKNLKRARIVDNVRRKYGEVGC